MPRSKAPKPKLLDFDMHAVEQMVERIRSLVAPDDLGVICALVQTVTLLTELLRSSKTTIARLRRLFGLTGSEKLADVVPDRVAAQRQGCRRAAWRLDAVQLQGHARSAQQSRTIGACGTNNRCRSLSCAADAVFRTAFRSPRPG
ncbi:MAG: hypothetical protein MUF54_21970 [Polyangiaceae bacterium]|nr:hypothetical protein [Polyangiaceae bacterium]